MMTTERAKHVLVITAHPDDADVHAGGTLARWVDVGHKVQYVVFTSGDKGHDEPAITPHQVRTIRQAEQRQAAEILGIQQVAFLDYADGDLSWVGSKLVEDVTRLIRDIQPDTVLTHDPYAGPPHYKSYQLHPDHRALGFAVIDAIYFRAPGPLFYPEQVASGLPPHRVSELYLIMGDNVDYYVDISLTFERKLAAIRAHNSQFGRHSDLENFFRRRAADLGAGQGFALAEAFKRLLPG